MKCRLHFFLLIEHFSIEHAEAHFGGEESEMNLKYEWEDELEIKNEVKEIVVHDYTKFPLQGELPDEGPFSYDVEGMKLFEIVAEDEPSTYVGCSETIIDGYEIDATEDEIVLKVYLKGDEPMSNPIPGIYIALKEFPKELTH